MREDVMMEINIVPKLKYAEMRDLVRDVSYWPFFINWCPYEEIKIK